MGYPSAVVLASLIVTISCAPLEHNVDVTIIKSELDELEVRVEWENGGMGMLVQAAPDRLAIRSLDTDGELFLYGEQQRGSGTFYTAQGQSFFTRETVNADGTLIKTDYMIPNAVAEQAKEAFQQKKIHRMLGTFDRNNTHQSAKEVIEGLLHRPEVLVLEKTIHILGEEYGIIGRNNRGALLFYTTVLQLVRGRGGEGERHDHTTAGDMNSVLGSRDKRQRPTDDTSNEGSDSGLDAPAYCKLVTPPRLHTSEPTTSEPTTSAPSLDATISPTHTLPLTTSAEVSDVKISSMHTSKLKHSMVSTKRSDVISPTHTVSPAATTIVRSDLIISPHGLIIWEKGLQVPVQNGHLAQSQVSTSPTPLPLVHICPNQPHLLCEDCFHGHECTCGHCPFVEDCLGMCGRGCSCWRFVCGDCCVWPGCMKHDLICRESFISFGCLLPLNFACNGY